MRLSGFHLLERRHKLPAIRGAVADLLSINKKVKSYIAEMGVHIRSTPVNLKHKFVLVPLVYNKVTLSRDLMEMSAIRDNGAIIH